MGTQETGGAGLSTFRSPRGRAVIHVPHVEPRELLRPPGGSLLPRGEQSSSGAPSLLRTLERSVAPPGRAGTALWDLRQPHVLVTGRERADTGTGVLCTVTRATLQSNAREIQAGLRLPCQSTGHVALICRNHTYRMASCVGRRPCRAGIKRTAVGGKLPALHPTSRAKSFLANS